MKFYFSKWKLFFFIFKIVLILKISVFYRHPILITGENHISALQIKKLKISQCWNLNTFDLKYKLSV